MLKDYGRSCLEVGQIPKANKKALIKEENTFSNTLRGKILSILPGI